MIIGIDSQATSELKTGLGIYAWNLTKHLEEIDTKNRYILLTQSFRLGRRTTHRLFWENVTMPLQALKQSVDILHTTGFSAPCWKGPWRSVVTIHDIIGKIFPENLSWLSRWYWSIWLPFINSKSDRIIVDSNCTKQDLIRYVRINPDKICVIPLAAGSHFTTQVKTSEIDSLCRRLGIQKPYLLFVGSMEPRKNLPRIINAFEKIKAKKKIPHQLVVAGLRAVGYSAVDQLISERRLSNTVKCLNYVNDRDLIELYNGCDLFLFPTLYEGFGIPILEAMKCGAPVLTSNLSSIPEVAGDAAVYIDPYSEEEIGKGIDRILSDSQLRKDLREKGFRQAGKFNWNQTASQTLAVYEELLASD